MVFLVHRDVELGLVGFLFFFFLLFCTSVVLFHPPFEGALTLRTAYSGTNLTGALFLLQGVLVSYGRVNYARKLEIYLTKQLGVAVTDELVDVLLVVDVHPCCMYAHQAILRNCMGCLLPSPVSVFGAAFACVVLGTSVY